MATNKLLDCGHPESPHASFITGYGIDKHGKKHCYDCCLEIEKRAMREHGTVIAYHSKNAVTTWTGKIISDKVYVLSRTTDNFGGERTYLRFLFEGQVWSGFSMGLGMYLRAKRTKLKGLYA